jgi:hypothetical protein
MKRIPGFLAALMVIMAAGCAMNSQVPDIRLSDEPGVVVQHFPDGHTGIYDYATGDYTVSFPNGAPMFRASGLNGREIIPVTPWVPARGIEARKHFWYLPGFGWVFDYGLPEGTTIRWGGYDLYEGWYETGRRMYVYDFRGRTYVEWNRDGKVIETGSTVR